jgi:DNA-binding Lrp family transcriptional regulator
VQQQILKHIGSHKSHSKSEEKEPGMKDVELKLISELMKNSRRSDRDLARALKVSQPTVSRIRTKLEKEGIINEYTMIPDLSELGLSIMSITFAKFKEAISEQKIMEVRKQVRQTLQTEPMPTILAVGGIGLSADRVVIAFHENYSAYSEHLNKLKQHPLVKVEDLKSFLIDLKDRSQYLPLTLSELAKYLVYARLQKK